MKRMRVVTGAGAMLLMASCVGLGCAVIGHDEYHGPKYVDASAPTSFETPNLESHDLQAACQNAVGRLVASNLLMRVNRTPVFLVEEENFKNVGDGDFNTKTLVDLFRHELVNAGGDQLRVVRQMDPDTVTVADFIVAGRVSDVVNYESRVAQAYTQIAFEVVYASTNEVVFSDLYAVKKTAAVAPELY